METSGGAARPSLIRFPLISSTVTRMLSPITISCCSLRVRTSMGSFLGFSDWVVVCCGSGAPRAAQERWESFARRSDTRTAERFIAAALIAAKSSDLRQIVGSLRLRPTRATRTSGACQRATSPSQAAFRKQQVGVYRLAAACQDVFGGFADCLPLPPARFAESNYSIEPDCNRRSFVRARPQTSDSRLRTAR